MKNLFTLQEEPKSSCSKCRTTDFDNCHSIHCPMRKEEPKQENCCTPIGQIKRYVDCKGCDKKPNQETILEAAVKKYGTNPYDHSEKDGFIQGANWQKEKMFTKDFILGFLEYIEGTYSYSNIFDHWYLHSDTSKSFSRKELLKEYQQTILPPNKLDT